LEVNRYDQHLDFAVSLSRAAAGRGRLDGQCGNYNGDVLDDAPEAIQKRAAEVPFAESLFVRSRNTSLLYRHLKQWQDEAAKLAVPHASHQIHQGTNRAAQQANPPVHRPATTTLHAVLPVHQLPMSNQSAHHAVLPVKQQATTTRLAQHAAHHTSTRQLAQHAVLNVQHQASTTRLALPLKKQATTTRLAHDAAFPIQHKTTTTRTTHVAAQPARHPETTTQPSHHADLPVPHQVTTTRVATLPGHHAAPEDARRLLHHIVPEDIRLPEPVHVQDTTSLRRRRQHLHTQVLDKVTTPV